MNMMAPTAEARRLRALQRYSILDTPPEGAFDRITAMAADLLDVPLAIVSLVDADRVWFKSVSGMLGVREIERQPGFCSTTIEQGEANLIPHISCDSRFGSPIEIAGAQFEFYVGVPLQTHDGYSIGGLCCLDVKPRRLSDQQINQLQTLGAIVMDEMELRFSARRISELNEQLAETCNVLEHRTTFDAQTGLLTREATLERGARLMERARREGKRVAVLQMDVDRFKQINDSYGHAAGDAVLREVGARLSAGCRTCDVLGRIGGEEFLMVIYDVEPTEAREAADRLRGSIARSEMIIDGCAGLSVPITLSGGLYVHEGRGRMRLGDAMGRADKLLYRAKAEGRNQIIFGD